MLAASLGTVVMYRNSVYVEASCFLTPVTVLERRAVTGDAF